MLRASEYSTKISDYTQLHGIPYYVGLAIHLRRIRLCDQRYISKTY